MSESLTARPAPTSVTIVRASDGGYAVFTEVFQAASQFGTSVPFPAFCGDLTQTLEYIQDRMRPIITVSHGD